MDFDALLDDEAFGEVDFDKLENDARSNQQAAPPPASKPVVRQMSAHPVPKPYHKPANAPIASSSRTTLNQLQPNLTQTTLWGSQPIQVRQGVVPQIPSGSTQEATVAVKVCKKWDRSVWSQLGWGKSAKQKKKGKKRLFDEEDPFYEDEEDIDNEPLPACLQEEQDPELTAPNAPPMRIDIDLQAASHWVYPIVQGKDIRDYQFNIAHKALFNNVLCSLPTGLGKTFIAAVVMMNFYRCFPQGKIIFTAPTKPLVAQQIEACHSIGGIPNEDSCEMTGSDIGAKREPAWRERRVFYCTPQTVVSDLKRGRLDASKVVLVVVDEAHKASGDYAYCTMVRFLMAKNPHFRVLALTATPGTKSEAVQAVIDNLHIGHIEVRTEQSIDIQRHTHQKEQDIRIISLSPDILHLRDVLYKLIEEPFKVLKTRNYLFCHTVEKLTPFQVVLAGQKIGADRELSAQAKGPYWSAYRQLDPLIRALENLMTKSVKSFFNKLKEIKDGNKGDDEAPNTKQRKGGGASKKSSKIASSEGFVTLFREAQQVMSAPGGEAHPKMVVLLEALVEHFKQAEDRGEDTKAMVFCSHRDMVEELVEFINQKRPMLRAQRFVGQGDDSKGRKGFKQKEQMAAIDAFKQGIFNILVATSIGEEGLDIGEVDVIYCYDAQKSPIRMLQRVGRTGRARQGKIVVLMAEGREEGNWQRATDSYNDVQNALVHGKTLTLYEDCDQLFPNRRMPCEKTTMTVEKYEKHNLTTASSRNNSRKSTTEKKKKPGKTSMPPPEDLPMLFQKGGEVLASRRKRKTEKEKNTAGVVQDPSLTEAELLNERRKAALPTLEQLDELTSLSWPAPKNRHRVTRPTISVDQRFHHSTSRFSAQSSRWKNIFIQTKTWEEDAGACEAWESDIWKTGFKQSTVYWWDEADKGTSSNTYRHCRTDQRECIQVDVDTARRARSAVEAFDLDVATQFLRHEAEEGDDSEDQLPTYGESFDEGSQDDMADFIVPDDVPVQKIKKKHLSKFSADTFHSDDNSDSALAQNPLMKNNKMDALPRNTKSRMFNKIAIEDSSQDDLPDLPDVDDLSLTSTRLSPYKAARPLRSPPKQKRKLVGIVDLVSDSDDELPPPVSLHLQSEGQQTSKHLQTNESVPNPSLSPAGAPKEHSLPASHVPQLDVLDSSDEEMLSMPKLPAPSLKTAGNASNAPAVFNSKPKFTSSSPPVHLPAAASDDEEDMFGSFVVDSNVFRAIDEAEAAQERGPRPPSPATLAMPPPPPTTTRKRNRTQVDSHEGEDAGSSSAVKLPRAGKARSTKTRARKRVIPNSSSPRSEENAFSSQQDQSAAQNNPSTPTGGHRHPNVGMRKAQVGRPVQRNKAKRKKRNPFIAASQAVCSDGSNNATSDENLSDAPNTSDREALTDGEVEDGESMMRFYKDSIRTQAPHNQNGSLQFGQRIYTGAAFKMNFGGGDPNFVATQRMSDDPVSDYLDESFCVADDVVEYESDHEGGLFSDM